MVRDVVTVGPDYGIGQLCDLMKLHNIKGVPVVDDERRLIGIVTQDDVLYGRLGLEDREGRDISELLREGAVPAGTEAPRAPETVREIMTSPAISANEGTPVEELCRMMWTLRIHRIPILTRGRVTGIVSPMDLCKAVATGAVQVD